MDLTLYPVFIILGIILYYFLSKKKSAVPENTAAEHTQTPLDTWNEMIDQREERPDEFYARVQFHFECFLDDYGFEYYYHAHSRNFMVRFPDQGGQFSIQPVFSHTGSYVQFQGVITVTPAPDHNLSQVAELINRLNGCRVLSSIYLDYEDRHIKFRSIFNVPRYNMENEGILFHMDSALQCFELRPYLNRVVFHNEEPVLVALDYAN